MTRKEFITWLEIQTKFRFNKYDIEGKIYNKEYWERLPDKKNLWNKNISIGVYSNKDRIEVAKNSVIYRLAEISASSNFVRNYK